MVLKGAVGGFDSPALPPPGRQASTGAPSRAAHLPTLARPGYAAPVNLGLEFYQHQHADLLQVAAALQADLAAPWGPGAEAAALRHLVRLSGKLTFHLDMEDRNLYPALLASADPDIRSMATRFEATMGGLRSSADGFFRHWLRPEAIDEHPEAFRDAALALLGALSERIAAEDALLYPLVSRAG